MAGAERTALLELTGIDKRFDGAVALDNVSLEVRYGEVHALLGENGSGKSTLIKVLAGYHAPDRGSLWIHGQAVALPLVAGTFHQLGLAFVHQNLGLVPSLTVLENLLAGEFARPRNSFWLGWRTREKQARALLGRYGLDLDLQKKVSELSALERSLLALVRALGQLQSNGIERGLLVLDEPTVFLPKAEVAQLFTLLRDIVRTGTSVLFVSHDLEEVVEIADRLTVLRDGRVVGTRTAEGAQQADLVRMIVGHDVLDELHTVSAPEPGQGQIAVTIRDVRIEGGADLSHVELDVHRGEILGLTGLAGSGFESLPYAAFGAMKLATGRMSLNGVVHDLRRLQPKQALSAGVALVPADRQSDGCVLMLSIAENIMGANLSAMRGRFGINRRAMAIRVRELLRNYHIRPADPNLKMSALSGGNAQRVVLAKWLQLRPKLILLHELTQGVDVGARVEIFKLIREVAENGTTVICASSDYEQLAALCSRVVVVGRHSCTTLSGPEVTKAGITEAVLSSGEAGQLLHVTAGSEHPIGGH